MQRLNGSYAQWFNREYERTGHLFGDRYHAVLVERESHARELVRYIARNPVRAGLCKRPEDWPWSSYAATLGLAPTPAFLNCDELLSWFAPQRAAAIRRLKAFVDGS
jgi:putative transposase